MATTTTDMNEFYDCNKHSSQYDFYDPSEEYDSDCESGCCNEPRYFYTCWFTYQTRYILTNLYYRFNKRFPNLFINNHAEESFFGNIPSDEYFSDVCIKGREYYTMYDLRLLYYTISHEKQKNIFKKNGYIVMNEYNPLYHENLVIGCGHFPIENNMSCKHALSYSKKHSHQNCYTIDGTLSTNPDTIGIYGEQVFPHLPDNSFETIYSEGSRLQPTLIFLQESKRLLNEGGKFYCDGLFFFKKENGKISFNKNLGENFYLGIPDMYSWTYITNSQNLDNVLNEGKDVPKCKHPMCNYLSKNRTFEKDIINEHSKYYDEDDAEDIVFIRINFSNRNFMYKDLSMYNHSIKNTKYNFVFYVNGTKILTYTYIPNQEIFIPSNRLLLCGHIIPLKHDTLQVSNIKMVFTSENDIMKHACFTHL